ncbi:hypothetical protein BJX99DRAFT_217793 [Aspergillus californicus]
MIMYQASSRRHLDHERLLQCIHSNGSIPSSESESVPLAICGVAMHLPAETNLILFPGLTVSISLLMALPPEEPSKPAGVNVMAEAIYRTYGQIVAVFKGETDFLDLLVHDGTLAGIYDWINNI